MYSLCENFEKLILYSATRQTWNKHCSAWKLFNDFYNEFNIRNHLPIDVKVARAFVTWAVTKKSLKPSTVKSYISSLNIAHTISSNGNGNLNLDPCIKLLLKGADNVMDRSTHPTNEHLPMNPHLLEVLGHRVSELDWNEVSRQVFWTACVVSFFTSCRMGEILPSDEKGHDPETTLLWKNLKILNDKENYIVCPLQ